MKTRLALLLSLLFLVADQARAEEFPGETSVAALLHDSALYDGRRIAVAGVILCLGQICMVSDDPGAEDRVLVDITAIETFDREILYGMCTSGRPPCKGAVEGWFRREGPTGHRITAEAFDFR